MILDKLTVENFRQLAGRGEVRFAPPGDRNVTVVLGQNGAGKSTLLNAFLWCLYGRIDLENPGELVCHKAAYDAPVGGTVAAEVTLTLKDDGDTCKLSRRAEFRKLDGGRLEPTGEADFRIVRMGPDGSPRPEPDPVQAVNQLLPEGLSKFFFFRGEDMERLALRTAEEELEKGVREFLNLTQLERAEAHLKAVGKEFDRELGLKATTAVQQRNRDETKAADDELTAAQIKLETARKNIAALGDLEEEVRAKLSESEAVRPLLERRARLRDQLADQQRATEGCRLTLQDILSRDGYLWAADKELEAVQRLTAAAKSAGDIPARIKPTFVDHLLETGGCVCGRPLDEAARSALTRWRAGAGLAALEEAITGLAGGVRVLADRRNRLTTDLKESRVRWAEARQRAFDTQGQISAADSELGNRDYGEETIRQNQAKLRQFQESKLQEGIAADRAEQAILAANERLDALRKEGARINKDHVETEVFQRRLDATRNVAKALADMKAKWLGIVQEYLNGQLQRSWQRVAQLDRRVEFTPDFRLSVKERGPDGEWTASASSSANLQAVALCFVSALIKLADDIGRHPDSARRGDVFRGGQYPLVMDAPFAKMEHFKTTVPAGLRAVVPQMVVFSSLDQWAGEVETNLRPAAGAYHVLELHSSGQGTKDRTIRLAGRDVDYVVHEPDANMDWTHIREVTP